jgi:fructosamine-3-kinase
MADNVPLYPEVSPSRGEVDAILTDWLGAATASQSVRPLSGGMLCTILEVSFDGPRSPIVLKLTAESDHGSLDHQERVIRYIREHTRFPLPEVYRCDLTRRLAPYSYLIMERVPGRHLGEVRGDLSEAQHRRLQEDMADAVAELHSHRAERYGVATTGETWDCWIRTSVESLEESYEDVREKLSPEGLARLRRIIAEVPGLLTDPGPPCLTHADLWANNIMVHEGRLERFLDPGGLFAPAERDLADLELWRTVDQRFMDRYHEHHPRREGYERRRQVYWLGGLLVHVWLFGTDKYVRPTEEMLRQMAP